MDLKGCIFLHLCSVVRCDMAAFGTHPQELFVIVKGKACNAHFLIFLNSIPQNTIDNLKLIGREVGFRICSNEKDVLPGPFCEIEPSVLTIIAVFKIVTSIRAIVTAVLFHGNELTIFRIDVLHLIPFSILYFFKSHTTRIDQKIVVGRRTKRIFPFAPLSTKEVIGSKGYDVPSLSC